MRLVKIFSQESKMTDYKSAVRCTQTLLIGILFLFGLAANAGETTEKNNRSKSIISLGAFLYYQEKGEFSRDDFLAGWVALRNTIGGHTYDVESPSGAFLVFVGVSHARPHSAPPSTLIQLTVKQK